MHKNTFISKNIVLIIINAYTWFNFVTEASGMKKGQLGVWLLGIVSLIMLMGGLNLSVHAATSDQSLARVKAKGTLVMGT